MIDLTEGSRMRTNASGSPKTQKPNIIPKGQKPMLDERGHLECEMEELRLEIKDNAERIDKLCNLLKQNNTKLRTLKGMTNQTPCNHRTPPKYNVEYLDDKMVIVNGIQYQRVEEQKPQTLSLYDFLLKNHNTMFSKSAICDIVRGWLIDHTAIETEDAEKVTFTIHKEQLQRPK